MPLAEVRPGMKNVVVRGVLEDMKTEQSFRRFRSGPRPVVVTSARLVADSARVSARWFHQRYLDRTYPSGTEVYLVGSTDDEGRLLAPEVERVRADHPSVHVGRLVPVYPETAGVSSRMLRYLMDRVLPLTASLREYLPSSLVGAEGLLPFPEAVAQFHFPDDDAALKRARERLSFDELFLLQLAALVRRAARRAEHAPALPVRKEQVDDALRGLPFVLTSSQHAALKVTLRDLSRPVPMVRLLAGDVGSGKTVVAGLAALAVTRAGGQTALLAPTEILAQQHADTLRSFLEVGGCRVACLTSSTSAGEREQLATRVAAGTIDILVGTHALLHTPPAFPNLCLVVVDEQHRFGVIQRGELTAPGPSGQTPHFLSLSATPIPRTLQLTAYGDVDVSSLDPRPEQRTIRTEIITPEQRNTMYATLQNRIAVGGQVFVVCPRVEESPEDDRKSVEAEYRRLREELFRGARIAKLHGKMRSEEKLEVLKNFRERNVDLLVASTVIEVGVDIPNADTLMVEGSEHFGLATLHQLRGRVGRRGQDAVCFLVTETDDLDALSRLDVLLRARNGLEIAEEDLRRRGPGEVYGTRQHGGVTLKVASLADVQFLLRVRAAAERLLTADTVLSTAPILAARIRQLNVNTHFE